ncbi:MAG: methylenetetrahydrofolate reductase [Candidatus Aureabacteria bacterium]|nr:methylenetetrahydrofolate reductase [Candidatus Auribacterota bacterium]
MRIGDLISTTRPFLSLEFFPPRERSGWPAFFNAVESVRITRPLFVSVTYGAMGSTREDTLDLVTILRRRFALEAMAHLTCIGATAGSLRSFLDAMVASGIDNVLALRGDPPSGERDARAFCDEYRCAADLVSFISRHYPRLGIGVAAYPEGHPESASPDEDLSFLKAKLDRGADFAITQLFFDNARYWRFVERARRIGIDKPIIPGILPVFSIGSVEKIVSLSHTRIPDELMAALVEAERHGGQKAVRDVGVRHALAQAQGLLKDGAPGVHLYTLNKADACLEIARGVASFRGVAADTR